MAIDKQKLQRLLKLKESPALAIFEFLQEIENKIEKNQKESEDRINKKIEILQQNLQNQVTVNIKNELQAGSFSQVFEKINSLKGDKGGFGDRGRDGKDADETKIIDKVVKLIPIPKDGKDGKNPLIISKTPPRNPQKGDLWYQEN